MEIINLLLKHRGMKKVRKCALLNLWNASLCLHAFCPSKNSRILVHKIQVSTVYRVKMEHFDPYLKRRMPLFGQLTPIETRFLCTVASLRDRIVLSHSHVMCIGLFNPTICTCASNFGGRFPHAKIFYDYQTYRYWFVWYFLVKMVHELQNRRDFPTLES